jgi:hypothetical protein
MIISGFAGDVQCGGFRFFQDKYIPYTASILFGFIKFSVFQDKGKRHIVPSLLFEQAINIRIVSR